VRELENVIERAILINPGPEINPEALFPPPPAVDKPLTTLPHVLKGVMDAIEREKIAEALQRARGNRSHTARLLGISRSALYKKLKLLDLPH
jgi:DNA-binding NtrC family response regulator